MTQPTGSGDPRDPGYAGAPVTTDPRYVEAPQPMPLQPVQPARRVEADATYAPSWRGWRAGQIVYTIGGIVAVLIVIRIIFELLAANPQRWFQQSHLHDHRSTRCPLPGRLSHATEPWQHPRSRRGVGHHRLRVADLGHRPAV